ncbi:auxin-responsive GH3 family protein [Striga asiatica]|uniref:Auxin-responsive GH3 family protein n=1 Tax=Striga asiatica TaxID=4170 RepID=A0A5A7PYK6_STRAF|nr:auxin-responsive GH3 family protein [Striga asiatica]
MLEKMEEKFDPESFIEEFEWLTRNAGRVQKETLKRILEENGETEYLRKCGVNGLTDPDSYRARVPIATHNDFEPYIQKIADGTNQSALTGKPITTISLSSGTTQGKPKFVPFNDELMESTTQIYKTSFAFRNSSKQFKTKGGLSAGTATTNVYRNSKFKKTMKSMQTPCCSPDEVIFGPDFHQSLYCHLLCGLISRQEIQVVSSTFAHSIVHAFRTFEQIWEELVEDIRKGSLSSRITVPSIRAAIEKVLGPKPELADLIYSKCVGLRVSNWYGLIEELFPNTKYIYGIMTGSMEPYLKKLRHYAGGLPLCSADYGSSEGWIGANVNPELPPEQVTYAVLPNIGFFEFIPLNVAKNGERCVEPEAVGLTEVKVGEEYEILLTNCAGLYRYRLGDVVKVNGFHNSTPKLQFVCRKNLLLTINIDKNTEKDLQLAVEAAGSLLAERKLEVVDFTSRADPSGDPARYVVFWEINGEAEDEVLQECCDCLDRSFLDAGYMSSRKTGSIGPLELRVVRKGTFHKILDHYVGLGAAVSQFKTPRCVGPTNAAVLQILSANGARSYFSAAYD